MCRSSCGGIIGWGTAAFQYLPSCVQPGSWVHRLRMISMASRVMSRFSPLMPSTWNISQSVGEAAGGDAEVEPAAGDVVEHGHPVGQLGRVVVGQEEAAGADADVLGLAEAFDDEQVGRGVRLPHHGVVLADPGLLEAELVGPDERSGGPTRGRRRGCAPADGWAS